MRGFRCKHVVAAVLGAALTLGLAVTTAGADTGRSVKILRGPSSFSALNPCNGQTVQTTGVFRVQVATDETDTVADSDTAASVHVRDVQTGGGYSLRELADGEFSASASSYVLTVKVTFTNGSLSFYGTGTSTVQVDGTGMPTSFLTSLSKNTCGEP